jgi:CyaY protein
MTEGEFDAAAAETLAKLERALETAAPDIDAEFKGEGVLELTLPDDSKVIVNRHGAAREIWVAARSGGFHFRPEGSRWLDTRDGSELFASLSRLLSEQGDSPVRLDSG